MRVDQTGTIENVNPSVKEEGKGIANYLQQAETADPFPFVSEIYHANKSGVSESGSVTMEDPTYQKPGPADSRDAASQLEQSLANDMDNHKNQVAVLANTMSPEDYKEFQKSGFSMSEADTQTIITVTDEIKAVFAKAGIDISVYGDSLSKEQLQEIAGNSAVAAQIEKKLSEYDLPVTSDNLSEAVKAYEKADELTSLGEDAMAYLLKNQMAPSIQNVYKAVYASVGNGSIWSSSAAYQKNIDFESLTGQIEQLLIESGMEINPENIKDSQWLISNEILLSKENLSYMADLKVFSQKLSELAEQDGTKDFVVDAMVKAIADGKHPFEGMLIEGYSMWDQAADAMEVIADVTDEDLEYCLNLEQPLTVSNLKGAIANRIQKSTDQTGKADAKNTLKQTEPAAAEMKQTSRRTESAAAETKKASMRTEPAAAETKKASTRTEPAAAEAKMVSGEIEPAVIENGKVSELREAAPTQTGTETGSKNRQSISLITARRQLEEVRLMMTTQANYALLKKGISIDTRSLEELVSDLKEQENAFYKSLLESAGIPASEENTSLFAETTQEINELKSYPAYILNIEDTHTVHSLHEAGSLLAEKMKQASESYETLMTAPRADLGDHIQKAFRNVDDILMDLELETSESNRRAVRILAYNGNAITEENIAGIKAVDEEVQRAFSNMTPAVTLEMIRKGINPLDMEISQLNQAADEIRTELGYDERERFSKYLWKLEQKHAITEEERESYIGIYRLISQVEKTDGAVIGALQNQGAELTMRNLLTAVRSKKKGSMDYQVDEDFTGVDKKSKGIAIDDQITAAYQRNCLKDVKEQMTPNAAEALKNQWEDMTPEQLKEAVEMQNQQTAEEDDALEEKYAKEELAQYAKVLDAPEEIYALLERYDIPNSAENVLALQRMYQNPNEMFMQLLGESGLGKNSKLQAVRDLQQQLLEEFGEAAKTPEELVEAQEALAETAERVMETMIIEDPSIRSVDIRELRTMCRQFTFCAKRAKEESYMIPVETADGITGVAVKVVRGKAEKGLVDIFFGGAHMGNVAASFEAKENGISGMIATDREETRQQILEHLDEFTSILTENGETVDIHVTLAQNLNRQQFERSGIERSRRIEDSKNADERPQVQTKRLYHIAESLLQFTAGLR